MCGRGVQVEPLEAALGQRPARQQAHGAAAQAPAAARGRDPVAHLGAAVAPVDVGDAHRALELLADGQRERPAGQPLRLDVDQEGLALLGAVGRRARWSSAGSRGPTAPAPAPPGPSAGRAEAGRRRRPAAGRGSAARAPAGVRRGRTARRAGPAPPAAPSPPAPGRAPRRRTRSRRTGSTRARAGPARALSVGRVGAEAQPQAALDRLTCPQRAPHQGRGLLAPALLGLGGQAAGDRLAHPSSVKARRGSYTAPFGLQRGAVEHDPIGLEGRRRRPRRRAARRPGGPASPAPGSRGARRAASRARTAPPRPGPPTATRAAHRMPPRGPRGPGRTGAAAGAGPRAPAAGTSPMGPAPATARPVSAADPLDLLLRLPPEEHQRHVQRLGRDLPPGVVGAQQAGGLGPGGRRAAPARRRAAP